MVILTWAAQNFVAIAHCNNLFISSGVGFDQTSFPSSGVRYSSSHVFDSKFVS